MEKWYRKKAGVIIKDRVDIYAGKIGRTARSARVKEQKRRWGSCTASISIMLFGRSIGQIWMYSCLRS